MNKARRAVIEKAKNDLLELRTKAEAINEILSAAKDEEQEYHDNMPDNMQSSDKGERAQEMADSMDTMCEAINDFTSAVETFEGEDFD